MLFLFTHCNIVKCISKVTIFSKFNTQNDVNLCRNNRKLPLRFSFYNTQQIWQPQLVIVLLYLLGVYGVLTKQCTETVFVFFYLYDVYLFGFSKLLFQTKLFPLVENSKFFLILFLISFLEQKKKQKKISFRRKKQIILFLFSNNRSA